MKASEQGTRAGGKHVAVPRTLVFLTSTNPNTGHEEVLLLKGAATKRLWANRYNGVGGHVEADEDVYAAAVREVEEETGLPVPALALRGVVHIDTGHIDTGHVDTGRDDTGRDEKSPRPGVMMFVFTGRSGVRTLPHTQEDAPAGVPAGVPAGAPEGTPSWIPVSKIADHPLVDDLYTLLPLALEDGPVFFGHYAPDEDGEMHYRFRS